MQVLGAAGDIFLHQRQADALRDAALDLPLGEDRVDRPADIVRGRDLEELDRAEHHIDLQLGDLRAVAVDGVGAALALFVERRSGRVVGLLRREDEAVAVDGQGGQVDAPRGLAFADDQRSRFQHQVGLAGNVGEAQDRLTQRPSRLLRRLAGNEGLARGGSLAGVRRDRRVGAPKPDLVQRQAQRVGGDLGDHRVRALPDIHRALMQDDLALRRNPDLDRRWIGQRRIAAAVPAGRHADAASARGMSGVEGLGFRQRARPMRRQRFQAVRDADAVEPLARHRFGAVTKRVLQPERQPVHAELRGQLIVQAFLHDRRLRHAEAAEGTGDRTVGMDGVAGGAIGGRHIGAGRMDRHAVGHRRPPACIGSGVELAFEHHADDLAVGVRADACPHGGWVALGGGHHGFGARVRERRRSPCLHRHQTDQRLHRNVELGAEAAAGGGRHDPHLFGHEPQHLGGVVAVHVGRLRAGDDRQRVAVPGSIAGFRFDIGVLDIGRLDRARHDMHGGGDGRVGIAALDQAGGEHIVRSPGMDGRRVPGLRLAGLKDMGKLGPFDRETGEVEIGCRISLAGDQRHRLAAKPRLAVRQCRPVRERRDDAEAVGAGNIGGGEDAGQARHVLLPCVEVAEAEAGMMVRRADDEHRERVVGKGVRSEFFRACHLLNAVQPHDSRADGLAGRRKVRSRYSGSRAPLPLSPPHKGEGDAAACVLP